MNERKILLALLILAGAVTTLNEDQRQLLGVRDTTAWVMRHRAVEILAGALTSLRGDVDFIAREVLGETVAAHLAAAQAELEARRDAAERG